MGADSLQLDSGAWRDGSLLLCLHPDGSRLAVARGPALCICPLLPLSDDPAFEEGTAAAAHPAAAQGEGGEQQQQQALLNERRAAHGAAGPRTAGESGRYACSAASGPASVSPDDITALAWLAFARPPGASGVGSSGGGGGGDAGGGASGGGASRPISRAGSGAGGGVFAGIQAMLEDHELQRRPQPQPPRAAPHPGYSLVVLLAGTRGGAVQLHDAEGGAVLMRQQLHAGPVLSLAVRTWRMGLKPDDAVEDVTVGWADAVVRLAAWDLRAAAASCYAAAAGARAAGGGSGGGSQRGFGLWGSPAPAGPDIKPLAAQKWEVPAAVRGRTCVVCCGQRPRDLYSVLQGIGSGSKATGKTIFLAGGDRPACLAALEVDEQSPGAGMSYASYISSAATSVASGVMGLARTARSVAAAPLSLRGGLRYLVAAGAAAVSAGAPAADASAAGAPLAAFADASAGQRPPATGLWRCQRDDGRAVLALAPAPHGSLVAAVDGLGRVVLVETGGLLTSRMWKGYRDAQVAWMEVPAECVARRLPQDAQRRRRPEVRRPKEPALAAGADLGPAPSDGSREPPPAQQPAADAAAHGPWKPPLAATGATPANHHMPRGQQPPAARAQPRSLLEPAQHEECAAEGGEPGGVSSGGGGGGPYVLLLVLYAPRRQALELWWPLHGERVAALAAPPQARLLQRGGGGSGGGGELGTWRAAGAGGAAAPPMTPAGCMLCSLEDGEGGGVELRDVASMFGMSGK